MDSLFDTSQCNLPVIPLVDFPFVSECDVLPAPDAIFDCPDIDIPFTGTLTVPCPSTRAVGVVRLFTPSCHPEWPSAGSIGFSITNSEFLGPDGPECREQFHVDVKIPILCPTITVQSSLIYGLSATSAGLDFDITRITEGVSEGNCDDPCELLADIRLKIPCPQITGNGVQVTQDGCAFHLDVAGNCVSFAYDPVDDVIIKYEQYLLTVPTVTFTLDRNELATCEYHVELEIALPSFQLYAGYIIIDSIICASGGGDNSVSVALYGADGDLFGTVSAVSWLRGCCFAEMPAGTRVWVKYITGEGWYIVSHEQTSVVPIVLAEPLQEDHTALAYFNFYDTPSTETITVWDDLHRFTCALDGFKGWAICNNLDGSGLWQILELQQMARWIEFELTADLAAEDETAEVTITAAHLGEDPETSFVKSTLKWVGTTGAKGMAFLNSSYCPTHDMADKYTIFQLDCPDMEE